MEYKNPISIHLRLTKDCNADCKFCCSFKNNKKPNFMSIEDLQKGIEFLWNKIKFKGTNFISVEYVGGEISLIPFNILQKQVFFVREFFEEKGIFVEDGIQTNLLTTKKKILQLKILFNGKLGTSIDSFCNQRTYKGTSENYLQLMNKRENDLKENIQSKKTPAIFVVNSVGANFALSELKLASRTNRDLYLRPALLAGKCSQNTSSQLLIQAFIECFDFWFMKSSIILEPQYSILHSLLNKKSNTLPCLKPCPFRADCGHKSYNIEDNGDIFICQALADMKFGKIGNIHTQEWNESFLNNFNKRKINLDEHCQKCEYFEICQGGCAAYALSEGKTIFDRSIVLCELWHTLFDTIKASILKAETAELMQWLYKIEYKK